MAKTILFQGDSITDCGRSREPKNANEALGAGYVSLVAARLLAIHMDRPLYIHNRGVSGNRVVDLYARWGVDGLNPCPDIVSILIGVNDALRGTARNNGVEPERYQMFYQMVLDWTKKELPDARPVLMEPFLLPTNAVMNGFTAEMDRRREIVRELAKANGATFVPLQRVLVDASERAGAMEAILYDGVHPTLLGHQLIADEWLKHAGDLI